MKTNFEHLQSLNARSMALAIWNYASDYCAYCPKNMERPAATRTAARESASG